MMRSIPLALAALVLVLLVLSVLIGPADLAAADAALSRLIVVEIRLPRAVLAAAVGATLGLAGAALQGLLRNPLAEPGLIGATAAASLGAVIMLYSGLAAVSLVALPVGGMAGALIAVALVLALAGRVPGATSLILAGVAVTSFAAALTALALNLAPSPFAALEIVFWMLGSLAERSWLHVAIALPFMAAGWAMLVVVGRALDALSLGEDAAESLGFRIETVRRLVVLGAALSVGAATSVAGAIGFVGLVAPHLLRPLVGHRPGALLLPGALGGAALVLAADIAVRLFPVGPELKLGVVTALIGAPFFFWLVLRTRRVVT